MKKVIVGSRESKLARMQSEMVIQEIRACESEIDIEMITMKTTGDLILDRSLDKIGGKGLFVKELDRALLLHESDISVHSLKDMPMETSEELPIIVYSKREDPRDVLVLPRDKDTLDLSLPIGCSSLRRMLQFKDMYPEAEFKGIRGNVITRLVKLDSGEYGALILAAAGLLRLGLGDRISRVFQPEEMIPAAGQGILAVQGRMGEDYSFLNRLDDKDARAAAICERAFVRYLNGGCSSPVAAYARIRDKKICLLGLYYDEVRKVYKKGILEGMISEAEALGIALARSLQDECENRGV